MVSRRRFICGWAGTADRRGLPGTLGWEWAGWLFRNPLRRTAWWSGRSLSKIGWRRSTPFGLEHTHTHTTHLLCITIIYYSRAIISFLFAITRRATDVNINRHSGALTQFRTSINHVGRVDFHVANVQFHADVFDAHVTLSVQFDCVASQQPRAGHIVCTTRKAKK